MAMVMMQHSTDIMTTRIERRYQKRNRIQITRTLLLVILTVNISLVQCSEFDKVVSKIEELKGVGRSLVKDVYYNGTFRTGNVLWDNILNQCTVKPSLSCLQKNMYSYLDDSLGMNGDITLTDGVCFKKNKVDIDKFGEQANIIYLSGSKDSDRKEFEARSLDESENNIEDDEDVSESPIEEVTDALYNKGVKFLVSHDTQIRLPEFFFHGATLKISPRALTKTGALVHIDLQPKEEEGRLFFHKIKKYIRKKLLLAALAIILVIKLIALKLFFVFPIIFGVTTAKKLFMKLLLFLFPALSHIFKLCSWYHQSYHTTKFHHHHHLITHHHHKPPHGHGHGPPAAVYGPPHHVPHSTVITNPHQEGPPAFEHYPQDWELSGPGLGNEYIATDIHRNAINNFKPNLKDAEDINAWGLGLPPGPAANIGEISASASINQPTVAGPPGPGRINLSNRPVGPPLNPYHRNKKNKDPQQAEKEALIRAAALAARAPPSPVRDELLRVSAAKLHESNRVRLESELVKQQQQIMAAEDPETIAAEKFYGSLTQKVDSILSQLGANEAGCLERAVCSLYKDPFRHTPYSNLVSNELSKDSNELLPAGDSKMALRYYKYVQAARDGQEQKDCMAIYPECNIDYTKKRK